MWVRFPRSSSLKHNTMITIESSWGVITTDDKGNVIEKDILEQHDDERCYLLDAERFDIEEWDNWYERYTEKPSPKPSFFDVLELGFWKVDGTYNPPSSDFRNELYKNY
jgi:predicted methyltransferase